jgi:pyruvate kinase
MEASGLKGRVAYARWAGDEARFAWEVGVGKGEDGKPIIGV